MTSFGAPGASALDDQALLAAAQQGDVQATSALLERHQAALFRFARRQCGNEDDAADALQDAMISIARALPAFRGESALTTWMFTIARRACGRRARTRSRHSAPNGTVSLEQEVVSRGREPEDPRSDPEADAARIRLRAALRNAFDGLEPNAREVLFLRDVEGLSAQEVADVLELSVPAVKSRLHRARLLVRDALGPVLGADDDVSGAPLPATCENTALLLSKHLEGEISAEDCERMEAHVRGCRTCTFTCDRLRSSLSACSALRAADAVPAHVQDRVRSALREILATRANPS